jgi:5,10-methylene-tetrahydrofolate dehydrogenase/methenyl tetrahydrofolate cyclohydrolase
LSAITKNTDIIISAVGKPGIINDDNIKENQIIVDQIIVFGSYAQQEQEVESDLDLLVVSKDFSKLSKLFSSGNSFFCIGNPSKPIILLY